MTAENEHKLSIRLLSNVALGRGSQISLDIVKTTNYFILLFLSIIFHYGFTYWVPYSLLKT